MKSSSPAPTISISSNPQSITKGASSTLTVTATQRDQSDRERLRWQYIYALVKRRHAGRQPNYDNDLHSNSNRRRWNGFSNNERYGVTIHDSYCDHRGEPRFDYQGRIVHSDRNGDECHPSDGERLRWQHVYPVVQRRKQVVSPTTTTTYTATATGAGGTASATTSVTVSQSTTPTVTIAANPASITKGASSTLTVSGNECHSSDRERLRWQHLYPVVKRRHAGCQSNYDNNLYGNRDRSQWNSNGQHDRHCIAINHAHRDHSGKSRFDQPRRFVHPDRNGNQCYPGDRDRIRWQHLYPVFERGNAGRQPHHDYHLHGRCNRIRWQCVGEHDRDGHYDRREVIPSTTSSSCCRRITPSITTSAC